MPFSFYRTEIEGLIRIEPHIFEDSRGAYKKYYEKETFAVNGITEVFSENSELHSAKGALRGLHYQVGESQAKLIHVVSGALYDVALDLRPDSTTFGMYHAELLDNNNIALFIPSGFAHGFISLCDNTIFSYQCSGAYRPDYCGGIRWDDPELSIPWPLREYGIDHIIATQKDLTWPTLEDYLNKEVLKRI